MYSALLLRPTHFTPSPDTGPDRCNLCSAPVGSKSRLTDDFRPYWESAPHPARPRARARPTRQVPAKPFPEIHAFTASFASSPTYATRVARLGTSLIYVAGHPPTTCRASRQRHSRLLLPLRMCSTPSPTFGPERLQRLVGQAVLQNRSTAVRDGATSVPIIRATDDPTLGAACRSSFPAPTTETYSRLRAPTSGGPTDGCSWSFFGLIFVSPAGSGPRTGPLGTWTSAARPQQQCSLIDFLCCTTFGHIRALSSLIITVARLRVGGWPSPGS